MTSHDQVREICSRLPGALESEHGFGFSVLNRGKTKGFAWAWMERVQPKKPKVPNDRVLAVRVPGLLAKDLLLESDPRCFFTEPHYDGYPAILVRLDEIEPSELEPLLIEAWRCMADPKAVKAFDG